jgi:hypothetical protein
VASLLAKTGATSRTDLRARVGAKSR